MKFTNSPMRFGIFMGPVHKPGLNPTLSFEQDLQIIEHLDRLGFDEAWLGEHHSGGIETVGSPELMVAAASQRTKRIKLGTGVISIPYHNPFMVAERIVQLDHMTRGRVMFGVGPGQLAQDAEMIGQSPVDNRSRQHESLDVILRLFRGEKVTEKTDWYDLRDAELQLLPYSDFDVTVVSVMSPSGPQAAGKYGTGMISVAATDPVGVEKLAGHWDIWETEARARGREARRSDWRMMGPMHLAETEEKARADVRHGLSVLEDYRAHINPTPPTDFYDLDKLIDEWNASGAAVIGTPEMARKQIQRLIDKSGGFGAYLLMGVDWANFPATLRSYELFAEEVIPHFTGVLDSMDKSYHRTMDEGFRSADVAGQAQKAFAEKYSAERLAVVSS
ncbi:LLM class flavin-dependent oxidoreductase [Cryobacterium sp. TMS1-20-1]|uniref:LLM class flavin-dependent oxidoreductase n=1 Tax=Cryobacterium sp. TMS1-20-1 TaxID=1259223 RepID=UPI00106A36C3|nr:LLM class flavin-dependent oxidoreductase [Cryobacterium sp. TMS1-20-1]TFC80539.1 LLM class flavin-dependent oxidoreductase [Cryobacterium sp. TMS1-20-1]